MKRTQVVERNIELLGRFNSLLLSRPKLADSIPDGAEVVILPLDDPELLHANLRALEKLLLRNEVPTVLVRVGSSRTPATGPLTLTQPLEALSVEAIGA